MIIDTQVFFASGNRKEVSVLASEVVGGGRTYLCEVTYLDDRSLDFTERRPTREAAGSWFDVWKALAD